jgi:NAD(P)-dependent dehydrogenase (short-subunit alcohol dehydrogenase family)
MTPPDYSAMLRLDGQVHVVVGAGQGIGRETAHALGSAGATVLCTDIDSDRAHEVAAEIDGIPAICDVLREGEIDTVFANAERDFGAINGVTNIVGVTYWKPLAGTTEEDWLRQNAIIAGQALRTLRVSVPFLTRAGGGSVTFVASVSAFTSAPGHALYGMSKSALLSMVRTAAIELGPTRIRVNAVSPGATLTPRLVANPRFDATLEENARRTPLGRLATPSDIAAALLFFASPLSAHITGQELTVDGGLTNAWPLASPSALPGETR